MKKVCEVCKTEQEVNVLYEKIYNHPVINNSTILKIVEFKDCKHRQMFIVYPHIQLELFKDS